MHVMRKVQAKGPFIYSFYVIPSQYNWGYLRRFGHQLKAGRPRFKSSLTWEACRGTVDQPLCPISFPLAKNNRAVGLKHSKKSPWLLFVLFLFPQVGCSREAWPPWTAHFSHGSSPPASSAGLATVNTCPGDHQGWPELLCGRRQGQTCSAGLLPGMPRRCGSYELIAAWRHILLTPLNTSRFRSTVHVIYCICYNDTW